MAKAKTKWDFRDISLGLKILRNFLLGRKYTLHNRFPPLMAPRSLPQPDIPRGPDTKYSDKYYFSRSAKDSVLPPVVAPIAEGCVVNRDPARKSVETGLKADEICFSCAPTPGKAWWWDGHSYYECVADTPVVPSKSADADCKPKC